MVYRLLVILWLIYLAMYAPVRDYKHHQAYSEHTRIDVYQCNTTGYVLQYRSCYLIRSYDGSPK